MNTDSANRSTPPLQRTCVTSLCRITVFTAACVLVSNMIGTGIFGTTGFMARDLGNPMLILILWALGGVFALLGALAYSELGAALPQAGGEYVYLREAYGPVWGFLSGWTSFTIGFSAAIASCAYLFAIHLQELLFGHDPAAPSNELFNKVIALLMVWTLTTVHVAGVRAGGFVQRILTILKVASILALFTAGLFGKGGQWSYLTNGRPDASFSISKVLIAFLFVTFSYSGWNAAGYIASEIDRPERNIPRATIWGTLCVMVLYLSLNVFYLHALPVSALAAEPVEPVAQKAAAALLGDLGGRLVTAMLCVSILGAASAMIWTGPRVYCAMARDGVLPRIFAATDRATGTPAKSIVLQSLWISILILAGAFEALVVYAGFVLVVFSALAVVGVIVLRVRQPQLPRPFRTWLYPLSPLLYGAVALAVMWVTLRIRPYESLLGVATVAVGLPLYWYQKARAVLHAARNRNKKTQPQGEQEHEKQT